MGITTPAHPEELARNGVPLPEGVDIVPDPEVGANELQLLVEYIRFLAPPQAILPDDPEVRADIEEGEKIFAFMGCAACHTPSFTTSASESPALHRKRFRLYSDLLLHDMGPDLADICSPGTTPSEWKTARLVGLGHRSEFLHNGQAQTYLERDSAPRRGSGSRTRCLPAADRESAKSGPELPAVAVNGRGPTSPATACQLRWQVSTSASGYLEERPTPHRNRRVPRRPTPATATPHTNAAPARSIAVVVWFCRGPIVVAAQGPVCLQPSAKSVWSTTHLLIPDPRVAVVPIRYVVSRQRQR